MVNAGLALCLEIGEKRRSGFGACDEKLITGTGTGDVESMAFGVVHLFFRVQAASEGDLSKIGFVEAQSFRDLDELRRTGLRMGFELSAFGPVVSLGVVVSVAKQQTVLSFVNDEPDVGDHPH